MPRVTYEDIGGLRNEIQKVREMIELPIRHPEIFERIGIEAPKGVSALRSTRHGQDYASEGSSK